MTAPRSTPPTDQVEAAPAIGAAVPTMPEPNAPCGLYVHVPFCETKCGYCDFYSVPLKDRTTADVTRCTLAELDRRMASSRRKIHTIFCGGGTPTLLEPDDFRTLMSALGKLTRQNPVREFTVEANPATVDRDNTACMAAAGVTRVSMGAQSFFPRELETLERLHSPDEIAPSVRTLREGGITRLNLDLIFGIPGQSLQTWEASLARAVELEPEHLACYGLTYEPGTRLTAQRDTHRLDPCDEDLEADMYLRAIDLLAQAGYEQYEISNFARPGARSLHNVGYWRNQDFIGVGPSAAGCVNGYRYKNVADISAYVREIDHRGAAEVESERMTGEQVMTEMVMMQMRLNEGLSRPVFHQRCAQDPVELFSRPLDEFCRLGWAEVTGDAIRLTRDGRLVANRVIGGLVQAIEPSRLRVL